MLLDTDNEGDGLIVSQFT